MDGKFLTKETTDLVVKLIFSLFKAKIPWFFRGIAKQVLQVGIKLLNKGADKIIPDKADAFVNLAIQSGNKGDWDAAAIFIAKAENVIIDLPHLTESQEEKFFAANTNTLVQGIKSWIENKKK